MRDAKLVLRASWLRKPLDKVGEELMAVIPWMCFRAAAFKSSKSMAEQMCSRVLRVEGMR